MNEWTWRKAQAPHSISRFLKKRQQPTAGEEESSLEHNHIREISFSMQKSESMDYEFIVEQKQKQNHGWVDDNLYILKNFAQTTVHHYFYEEYLWPSQQPGALCERPLKVIIFMHVQQ